MPTSEAKIGVNDIGLLRSYAVFDYLRTYNGKPFAFDHYIKRFRASAASLLLDLKYTDEEVYAIILELVRKSDLSDVGIRLLLTGGYSTDSMSVGEPNFIVVTEKLPNYPSEYYTNGVKLITHPYQRPVAGSKTTDYVTAIKLKPKIQQHGAFDVLYHHHELVLEVSRNNIFFFKNKKLITPKDDILLGVTRQYVLEIAANMFEVEEREVTLQEMWEMDEVFITGTTKKIIPVHTIDERVFNGGTPGISTKELMQAFDDFVAHY